MGKKAMLRIMLLFCALLVTAPALAEDAFETTIQVHESVPELHIRVSDTGERRTDPLALRENLLHVEISAQNGSFSQELTYWSNETPGFEDVAPHIRMQDMNFDGYQDLTLLTAMGARNVFYTLSLWDAEAGQFQQVMSLPVWNSEKKAFSQEAEQLELCNHELNPQEGRIYSEVQDGYRFSTEIVYAWEGLYNLAPVSVADVYDAGKDMIGELVEMHGTQILRLWDQAYPEEWYYGQGRDSERRVSIRAMTHENALDHPTLMRVDNVDWVNLRRQDSIDSPSLARLDAGTTVRLLKTGCGEDGGWVRVLVMPGENGVEALGEHDEDVGLTGYIWRSYLTYVEDSVLLPGAR